MNEGGLNWKSPQESVVFELETQKVLKQIDFTELSNVFREIGIKSGRKTEEIEPLSRENIDILSSGEYSGLVDRFVSGHCSQDGFIDLNESALVRRARGLTLKWPAPFAAAALNILCHEEAHGSAYRGKKNRRTGWKMGLSNNPPDTGTFPYGTFNLLNEAVTDIIGERAFGEYLNRRRVVDTKDPTREIRASDWRDSYPHAHWVFDALTKRISSEFEVPEDFVVNAFIRGAYEGVNLASDDLRVLFEQSVSPSFYKNIQTAAHLPVAEGVSPTLDLVRAAAELKAYEWSQAVRAKWADLLSFRSSAT